MYPFVDSDMPQPLIEAATNAYRAIFENKFDDELTSNVNKLGARAIAMTSHGSVSDVGPGKHKVTMGSGRVGYDIDGKHIGWANPRGMYQKAIDSQDAFCNAYVQTIKSKVPDLPADDAAACARVMGDYDGLWYFMYGNGSASKSRRQPNKKLQELGTKLNLNEDGDTENKIKAIIDGADAELTSDQLKEMTRTSKRQYDNIPRTPQILKNIARMAAILKIIRDETRLTINVNSCYRSPAVNSAVGGVATSAHMSGLAMDLCAYGKNRELFNYLDKQVNRFDIDQLITYNTPRGNINAPIKFIHVGFKPLNGKPRHKTFASKK